jgi:hypothetical protein
MRPPSCDASAVNGLRASRSFHKPQFGARLEDYLAMTAEDYWEVGASGRIYDRDSVVHGLVGRGKVAGDEHWVVRDAHLRRLSEDTYAITYQLDQAGRLSRRLTLWRETADGSNAAWSRGQQPARLRYARCRGCRRARRSTTRVGRRRLTPFRRSAPRRGPSPASTSRQCI